MHKKLTLMALVAVSLVPAVSCQQSPAIHPGKTEFATVQSWPVIQPGDVSLQNFRPFRAVYERNYTQGLGPGAGEPRTDRVIITAERVGWHGIPAIAISLTDTGAPEFGDTMFRGMYSVIREDDMTVLFELGPLPGTGKDYYVARFEGEQGMVNSVTTATGEVDFQEIPLPGPGFGPGTWVMANAGLSPGRKLRVDPVYSSKANALAGFTPIGLVVEQETFTSLAGVDYAAWAVDYTSNPSGSIMLRRYLVDTPPYVLGTVRIDLDTGERADRLRLMEVTVFDE
ncbi:MAG: hypothetical protein JJ896_17670 [Rhodothermales bacterium]|nr:hypothetical protein [Rhodothermales bacterium]MBO6781491.1 hypothetical protein [Rhodothermales bacterium]